MDHTIPYHDSSHNDPCTARVKHTQTRHTLYNPYCNGCVTMRRAAMVPAFAGMACLSWFGMMMPTLAQDDVICSAAKFNWTVRSSGEGW